MDEYFIAKKAVEIILENINDHFIKCLINLSINDRYTGDIKLIISIVEYLKTYMVTRRNDILSTCIKYTNKSYYLQLSDNLFRLIHAHLTITIRTSKNVFIDDLINKYSTPSVASLATLYTNIKDDDSDDVPIDKFARKRIDTYSGFSGYIPEYVPDTPESQDASQDAGTLFKCAYDRLKNTRNAKYTKATKATKEFELQRMEVSNDTSNGDLR
jgi:hypothetical protein